MTPEERSLTSVKGNFFRSCFERTKLPLSLLGVDLSSTFRLARWGPQFISDLVTYRRLSHDSRFRLHYGRLFPILKDYDAQAGALTDYFFQDLWFARKIFSRRPPMHIDIGSRVDGFIAHLLTFMPVTVIDIRPLRSRIPGLSFVQEDATTLANFEDSSVDSISSLHAIEHFGLGRYGDPIRPDGCFRAMDSLARVLRRGGRLYFSVPIGEERLEFNAHRVFAPSTILGAFQSLRLVSLAAVGQNGQLLEAVEPRCLEDVGSGCGLFEFTK